jgi:hypothetical protein
LRAALVFVSAATLWSCVGLFEFRAIPVPTDLSEEAQLRVAEAVTEPHRIDLLRAAVAREFPAMGNMPADQLVVSVSRYRSAGSSRETLKVIVRVGHKAWEPKPTAVVEFCRSLLAKAVADQAAEERTGRGGSRAQSR